MEMKMNELFAEADTQEKVATQAQQTARAYRIKAIQMFMNDNGLNGTVVHKATGTRGILSLAPYEIRINFYPLKKDGTPSEKRNLGLNVMFSGGYLEYLENIKNTYETVNP